MLRQFPCSRSLRKIAVFLRHAFMRCGPWRGLSALDAAQVIKALKDPDFHVREHALRLSEPFLEASEALKSAVFAMTRDPEPRVQFQLAMTLGNSKDRRALAALVELTLQRATDPWFRTAILSSVAESASAFFDRLRAKRPSLDNPDLLTQLGSLIGGKHDAGEISRFLKALATQPNPDAGLKGLARGLKLAGVKNLSCARCRVVVVRVSEE